MQAYSPLLSLPREVLDRIIDFYLTFNHEDFEDTLRPHLVYMGDTAYSRPLPSLMLASKDLYRELSPIVHRQAILRVQVSGLNDRRISFAVHGKLRFDRLEKLWLLMAKEHANWNSWLSFFGEVTDRTKNLKALVIDWAPRPVGSVGSVGWTGRVNAKKEDEFFKMIGTLKELRLIQIYGDISPEWISRLEGLAPHVVYYRNRWWREPGMD
ncbi:hypothetical protein F5Y00DRAFT_225200 [Daldinia vernicosa]|uniref:uncharacterized protein n=1 Tax=Daldinia vernicosa TaxID=114800 RepID=UPI002008C8A9|nr:uncharacterized protein F5Y00DRAFT_225200 [Daldinia vernicosa]KAI0853038.1 hypothetical protein F5Y00DRAFT_225200 [Daldinia vernicosa]